MDTSSNDRAETLDVQVGRRLREFRKARGLSLETLAGRLGITYQQVQKYESGVNRISASTLMRVSTVLDVEVGDFFPERDAGAPRRRDATSLLMSEKLEALDPRVRQRLLDLVDALAHARS